MEFKSNHHAVYFSRRQYQQLKAYEETCLLYRLKSQDINGRKVLNVNKNTMRQTADCGKLSSAQTCKTWRSFRGNYEGIPAMRIKDRLMEEASKHGQ